MNEVKRAGDVLNPSLNSYECPKHGIYYGRAPKVLFGLVIKRGCPECEKERAALEADEEAESKKGWELKRLKTMNIGKRYWNTGFDNFIADTDELKHHLKAAKNFAGNPDGKLVMLGENGTGKTHLAVSILKQTDGIIQTAYEIGVRLRQSFGGNSQEWQILKELCEAKMLVIDEIGRSKGSDWDLNWISHVINKRHENMMPLVMISNRHLRQDCPQGEGGCEKCLEKFFDNDVISRIVEDGIVLKFTGADYRQRTGEEYRNQTRAENA
jgi:DNA replication protein DnaC